MKPIIEGCRAVIVNCESHPMCGEVVKVIRHIGYLKGWETDDRWLVDADIVVLFNAEYEGESCRHLPAICLQRIDDDQQALSTWDQVEADCGYFPNREVVV